ncbi:ribosomal protein S5 domain 2-type protein [Microdochium bolleyi]|uniref:Galactokinase n=1 Tax=Microdochium bolleyi TaxID=196109 RepID=A0A136JEZ4_9PEZI|nr:ribosomal protein S5 domain 2-type protein [Microdochium bolleyi]
MSGPVPQTTALQDVYTPQSLGEQGVRWNALLEKFQSTYGTPAEFVARSPGRVNIIGEHIDYSLYPCLPMAIYPDVIVAVSSTPSDEASSASGTYKLQVANVASDRFPTREFDLPHGDVEIDATKHEWTNYFKAGLRGALELLRKKHGAGFRPRSMKVLMDGTVPAGGGLSSSAAFVSAAALAVMFAHGERDIDKKALTEVAIVSERAVGVNSGGMDQSASVFSEMGSALLVSFSPSLSARPVFFPKTNPELCFLIAQSFVTSNKQVTGPIHYNLRVVEVSMAAAVLNAKLCPGTELPKDAGPLGVSLRGFHNNYLEKNTSSSQKPLPQQLEELIELTKSTLDKEAGYTVDDVAAATGLSAEDIKARFLSSFPVRGEYFKLRQRALHVFTEALRTQQFLALLEDTSKHPGGGTSATDSSAAYNQQLGTLMNETQDSCRDVYECSCPEIDQICAIIRGAGGYGSRLTGAGWGGCSVHLVPADKVDAIKAALVEEYYSKREVSDKDMEGAIVVSRPMSGSAVVTLDNNGGRF